jgi:hypothetical protein
LTYTFFDFLKVTKNFSCSFKSRRQKSLNLATFNIKISWILTFIYQFNLIFACFIGNLNIVLKIAIYYHDFLQPCVISANMILLQMYIRTIRPAIVFYLATRQFAFSAAIFITTKY